MSNDALAKKYKVIYTDPPWSFNSKKTGGSMKSGAAQQYSVMSIDEMKSMDIASLCDDDCLLVMWWVGSQPQEALDLVSAWGFKLNTMTGFVWRKLTTKGNPVFGMGYTARAGAECALIASRGKLSNLIESHSVRSVREALVGAHSEKPSKFRSDIEQLCGDVPRLEMFARTETPGWDLFGNEVESSISIDVKEHAA